MWCNVFIAFHICSSQSWLEHNYIFYPIDKSYMIPTASLTLFVYNYLLLINHYYIQICIHLFISIKKGKFLNEMKLFKTVVTYTSHVTP